MRMLVSLLDRDAVLTYDVDARRMSRQLSLPSPGQLCKTDDGWLAATGSGAYVLSGEGEVRLHCRCCSEVTQVAARQDSLFLLCDEANSISAVDRHDGALRCVRSFAGGVRAMALCQNILWVLCPGQGTVMALDSQLCTLASHALPCDGVRMCVLGRWIYVFSAEDRAVLWCAAWDPRMPSRALCWRPVFRAEGMATYLAPCARQIIGGWVGGVGMWEAASQRLAFVREAGLVQGAGAHKGKLYLADMDGDVLIVDGRGRRLDCLRFEGTPSGLLLMP